MPGAEPRLTGYGSPASRALRDLTRSIATEPSPLRGGVELALGASQAVDDQIVLPVVIEVGQVRLPALRVPVGLDLTLLAPHVLDGDG